MLFSILKHYLDTDTALKVSQSLYYFSTSISHGVENYFPRLWGPDISDAIFTHYFYCVNTSYLVDRCICPAPCRSRQTLEKNVLSWALAGTGSVLFIRQVAV